MEKKVIFATIIVLVVTLFFRFYGLGQIPHGINVDEASYGYDAYSLLQTGKDMWGNRGSSLESFGDYKPAGLAYTMIPGVRLLGLSTTVTRLPSAVFGFLTLIVTFFLLRFLLGSYPTALVGALILGLSPWHFGLSRLFYEPNSGLFFIACSIFFELKFIRQPGKIKYLLGAAVMIALGGYYYSVLRYLGTGMLAIALAITYFPHYAKIIKYGFVALLVWALVASLYLGDMLGPKGLIRLKQESALQEFGNTLVITENRQLCYIFSDYNPTVAKVCYLFWNKPGEKLVNTAKVYLQLLSPKYLFLNGYQKDVIPESYGAFLDVLAPFYFLGIFYLAANLRRKKEFVYIFLSWLFAAVPVALAGALNIHRNVTGLYLAFLICLYGIVFTQKLIKRFLSRPLQLTLITIILLGYLWSQSRFLANYFFVYTHMQPDIWQYDTPELMRWLGENSHGRFINYYDYDFGSLYYSFYNQLDPTYFQINSRWSDLNQYGWTHTNGVSGIMQSQDSVWPVICRHQDGASPSELLVMTGGRAEWQSVVEQEFKNATGIHVLHEIYDSKVLYNYLYTKDKVTLTATCANLVK